MGVALFHNVATFGTPCQLLIVLHLINSLFGEKLHSLMLGECNGFESSLG